jgi:general secretion pathway protein N
MRVPALVLTSLLVIGQASLIYASPGSETGQDQAPVQAQGGGNPLWAVPLAELSATGERPIFTPARRPSRPVATEAPGTSTPQQAQAAPDRPALSLLGTVTEADGAGGIGIFIDDIAKRAMRLKAGEQHEGWALRRVQRGRVVMEKSSTRVTLVLAPRDSAPPAAPALPTSVTQPAVEPETARPKIPAPTPVAAFDWTSILRQGEAGSH